MHSREKSIKTLLIILFSIFLVSCGTKEKGRVRFAVETDKDYTASEVWKKLNEVPLDRTGFFNPGITSHLWLMKVKIRSIKN
jgi:hypothetical protein